MEYLIVIGLVLLSAAFSGLTIGLFSLGLSGLERKIKMGDARAAQVLKIRKNGSLLLCTLLIGNVAVNSSLAIYLGGLAPGLIAGLIAIGLIVIFGEILPQALFTRYALSLASKTVFIVRVFQIILYPIAKPLALLLDAIVGKELPAFWSKLELQEIIKDHEDSPHSPIDADEERIILGAMSFSDREAYDIMTPKTVVYYLNYHTEITPKLIDEIKERGFSRIPVYEHKIDDMNGILYVKDLIGIDLSKSITVADICRKDYYVSVEGTIKLDNLLNLLIKKKRHIAFVFDEFGAFNGIVTLEDIIEEILKVEIVDEADKVTDLQHFAREKYLKRIRK